MEFDGLNIKIPTPADTIAQKYNFDVCQKNLRLFDSNFVEITDFEFSANTLKLPKYGEYMYFFEMASNTEETTSLFPLSANAYK